MLKNKNVFNADVGEESGNDAVLMPFLSWCNISCGAHAGNDKVIQETIRLAIDHQVEIGAHPSYPDRENFGRKVMDIAYDNLVTELIDQIEKVKKYTESIGQTLHHVKPHGALYNQSFFDQKTAKAILEAIDKSAPKAYLVTQKNSAIEQFNNERVSLKFEAFADRAYNDDLTLVSRSEEGAIFHNPKEVFVHVERMMQRGVVKTISETLKPIQFDTICVHGDHPNSIEILKLLHKEIVKG